MRNWQIVVIIVLCTALLVTFLLLLYALDPIIGAIVTLAVVGINIAAVTMSRGGKYEDSCEN